MGKLFLYGKIDNRKQVLVCCLVAWAFLGALPSVAQDAAVDNTSQRKLYLLHCAGCHGSDGLGNGIAARFVFPKPRDFTTGRFRLVRTVNRVASAEDIEQAISRGVPGTSMQGWQQLGQEAVSELTAEVLRLREDGVRKKVRRSLAEDGKAATTDEVDPIVLALTRPGEVWQSPRFPASDAASIDRGAEVFVKQSCHSCHGRDGAGSWQMDLVDDKGRPTWATDLRFDHYKGPSDALSIARRITLGMPGSAMPASRKLSEQELADLVHYCQSLAREERYELTNHQRAQRAVGFRKPPEPTESP